MTLRPFERGGQFFEFGAHVPPARQRPQPVGDAPQAPLQGVNLLARESQSSLDLVTMRRREAGAVPARTGGHAGGQFSLGELDRIFQRGR